MERDHRKRSRAVEGGSGGGHRKKERETKGKDVEIVEGVVSSLTDDEVDEFFAILRRMKPAVKYFGEGNGGGGRKLTETVLQPEISPSREADVSVKKRSDVTVLDLNTVPDGQNTSF